MTTGYWNGLPTEVERGTAEVADETAFPLYWARTEGIVGERIPVVRVVLDGVNFGGGVAYLDNRDEAGWQKVMAGGGPNAGHRDVTIVEGSFEPEVITLTVDDFRMLWDSEHTFEFMQSEDGALMAWGHKDAEAFLDEVFVFDTLCDPDGAERGDPGDIQHLWAVLDSRDDDGEWWIRWKRLLAGVRRPVREPGDVRLGTAPSSLNLSTGEKP